MFLLLPLLRCGWFEGRFVFLVLFVDTDKQLSGGQTEDETLINFYLFIFTGASGLAWLI